jgi:hypothetical protein
MSSCGRPPHETGIRSSGARRMSSGSFGG